MKQMTIIELLQQIFNATEEQTKSFTDGMKANKIFTSAEENIDIRHGKLKGQYEDVKGQLAKMTTDYEALQKSAGDSAELIKQATEKDATIAALQKELAQTKIDAKAHVKLLAAGFKPEDLDYVAFKLKANGDLELDDKEEIKGIDEKIAALKTQLPASVVPASRKNIIENHLPDGRNNDDGGEPKSLADALRMQFEENNN